VSRSSGGITQLNVGYSAKCCAVRVQSTGGSENGGQMGVVLKRSRVVPSWRGEGGRRRQWFGGCDLKNVAGAALA
jgi:hypothetical protein